MIESFLSSGRLIDVCSQTMSFSRSKESAFIPVNPHRRERVFAKYALADGLVRMCSTQKFYLRQMEWSVKTVAEYWRHVVNTRHGVWPSEVPMVLKFCISWITGHDHTEDSTREICGWMNRNIGITPEGPKAASVLYLTWSHGAMAMAPDTPRVQRPVCFQPMHVSLVSMPQPQFLHDAESPPMPPPDEESDSSDVALVDADDTEPINGFGKGREE